MRSTLFYIPPEFTGLPGSGPGWLFWAWMAFGVLLMGWLIYRRGWNADTASYLPLLGVMAVVLLMVLPNMVEFALPAPPAGKPVPLGVPIRGFGVMMMVAMVASVGLAMHRAWQMGIDPEVIISLAMWMIFPGIIGARLFFIVQYHEDFFRPTLRETLISLIDVTKGGLVVYGSVLAGVPFGIYYLIRRGLPVLAMLDIIAPSMVVGAALGRIGCFLNGCCYGGLCDWPVAMTFPPTSPPYMRQHELGLLYGMKIGAGANGRPVVERVTPDGVADAAGMKAGEMIEDINGQKIDSLLDALAGLGKSGKVVELRTAAGQVYHLLRADWPGRSLPIHPTQLYAALDAGLLALVLWMYYPFRRRDGEVFALLITIHPISRFLLEMVRSDEPGQFGTPLTISQWISLAFLVLAAGMWYYVESRPRGSALPHISPTRQRGTSATSLAGASG